MERYTESADRSKPVRDRQYEQLISCLFDQMKSKNAERQSYMQPDFTNKERYAQSMESYRENLLTDIGYPPPFRATSGQVREERIGEDDLCTIYRLFIPVAEGLDCYGILLVPKRAPAQSPLMLALHGGGGCPEMIGGICDTANYHDAGRRFVERGYIVFAPSFYVRPFIDKEQTDIPAEIRLIVDTRAKWLGSSMAAIELFKLRSALDVLLQRSDIDSADVGVAGLSYGGFYAMLLTAIDSRIRYCISSCFFNDRIMVNEKSPERFMDISWKGTLGKYADVELIRLIAPRPCGIEVGIRDDVFPIEGARKQHAAARLCYEQLGISERFAYVEFDGGHEFHLEEMMKALDKWKL